MRKDQEKEKGIEREKVRMSEKEMTAAQLKWQVARHMLMLSNYCHTVKVWSET